MTVKPARSSSGPPPTTTYSSSHRFSSSSDDEEDELTCEPNDISERRDPKAKLARDRRHAALRLKSTFEHIFEKYERDFTGIGDEIDLRTGEIVVNNGHLQSMRHERDAGAGFPDDYDDYGAFPDELRMLHDGDDDDDDNNEYDEYDAEEDGGIHLDDLDALETVLEKGARKKTKESTSTALIARPQNTAVTPAFSPSQKLSSMALPQPPRLSGAPLTFGSGSSVWGVDRPTDPAWQVPEINMSGFKSSFAANLFQIDRYTLPVTTGERSIWAPARKEKVDWDIGQPRRSPKALGGTPARNAITYKAFDSDTAQDSNIDPLSQDDNAGMRTPSKSARPNKKKSKTPASASRIVTQTSSPLANRTRRNISARTAPSSTTSTLRGRRKARTELVIGEAEPALEGEKEGSENSALKQRHPVIVSIPALPLSYSSDAFFEVKSANKDALADSSNKTIPDSQDSLTAPESIPSSLEILLGRKLQRVVEREVEREEEEGEDNQGPDTTVVEDEEEEDTQGPDKTVAEDEEEDQEVEEAEDEEEPITRYRQPTKIIQSSEYEDESEIEAESESEATEIPEGELDFCAEFENEPESEVEAQFEAEAKAEYQEESEPESELESQEEEEISIEADQTDEDGDEKVATEADYEDSFEADQDQEASIEAEEDSAVAVQEEDESLVTEQQSSVLPEESTVYEEDTDEVDEEEEEEVEVEQEEEEEEEEEVEQEEEEEEEEVEQEEEREESEEEEEDPEAHSSISHNETFQEDSQDLEESQVSIADTPKMARPQIKTPLRKSAVKQRTKAKPKTLSKTPSSARPPIDTSYGFSDDEDGFIVPAKHARRPVVAKSPKNAPRKPASVLNRQATPEPEPEPGLESSSADDTLPPLAPASPRSMTKKRKRDPIDTDTPRKKHPVPQNTILPDWILQDHPSTPGGVPSPWKRPRYSPRTYTTRGTRSRTAHRAPHTDNPAIPLSSPADKAHARARARARFLLPPPPPPPPPQRDVYAFPPPTTTAAAAAGAAGTPRTKRTAATAAAVAGVEDDEDEDELSLNLRSLVYPRTPRKRPVPGSSSSPHTAAVTTSNGSPFVSGSRKRVKKRVSMASFADLAPVAAAEALGDVFRTPGGTLRRCGEDGYQCRREFCFSCVSI